MSKTPRLPLADLTREIIAAFFRTYNAFGYGFLETVYQRALTVELRHSGLIVQEEVPFQLFHRGVRVGLYKADHVVEGQVNIEVKAGAHLDPHAMPQLINHLSASKLPVGLLLYFGPRPLVKRAVYSRHVSTFARIPNDR